MIKVICDPSTDGDDLDIGLCKAGFHPSPRKESESPYVFGHSFQLDASTRDFTFNAIYVDVVHGLVYDPVAGLSEDTRFDENGRCTHVLRSCAVVLDNHSLFESDVGGQFRFYKELMKSGQKFEVEFHPDTLKVVNQFCGKSTLTGLWIRKFVKKLFGGVSDHHGVSKTLANLNEIAPDLMKRASSAAQKIMTTLTECIEFDPLVDNAEVNGMLLQMHLPEDQKIFFIMSHI